MNLSNYDIQRISEAIVTRLLRDETFIQQIRKTAPAPQRLLTTRQVAEILGISRKTVCDIAYHLGGIRRDGKSQHWVFPEDGLTDRYIRYKTR